MSSAEGVRPMRRTRPKWASTDAESIGSDASVTLRVGDDGRVCVIAARPMNDTEWRRLRG